MVSLKSLISNGNWTSNFKRKSFLNILDLKYFFLLNLKFKIYSISLFLYFFFFFWIWNFISRIEIIKRVQMFDENRDTSIGTRQKGATATKKKTWIESPNNLNRLTWDFFFSFFFFFFSFSAKQLADAISTTLRWTSYSPFRMVTCCFGLIFFVIPLDLVQECGLVPIIALQHYHVDPC